MTHEPSSKVPKRARLYRAYDSEGHLLRIGVTGNMAYTMTYNERHITWWKPEVARVVEGRDLPREEAYRLFHEARREEEQVHPYWTPETHVEYGTARVYRAYDREGRLLYVGIAADLTRRIARHAREKPWWDLEVVYVSATPDKPRAVAFEAEQAAIRAETPLRNNLGADFASLAGKPRPYLNRGFVERWNRAIWWRSVGYVPSLPVWIDRAALAKPSADEG
jgi:predicted GIY-YIG superfamily endonuclease